METQTHCAQGLETDLQACPSAKDDLAASNKRLEVQLHDARTAVAARDAELQKLCGELAERERQLAGKEREVRDIAEQVLQLEVSCAIL